MAAEIHDLAHGLGIEIVPDQDADLIAPDATGRPAPSAQVGIVHHVIMEQGGGVDIFHQTAEQVVIRPGIAAEAGTEQEQQRTHPFAAAAQDMAGDGVDEGDRGIEVFLDLLFNALELGTVGVPDIGHRLDRGNGRLIRHGA